MGTDTINAPQARRRAWGGRLAQALRAELAGLADVRLWAALAALLAVFLLVPQLTLRYQIDAGYEEGVGSDLPFLQGFNTAEVDSNGTYRWTDDGAMIVIPGFGSRAATIRLSFVPVGPEVVAAGPQSIEVYANERRLATLPVRPEGSVQTVVVPPPVDGVLRLTVRTATFSLPGDPRRLGTPLDGVTVRTLLPSGPAGPDWAATFTWLAAVTLGWMAIRHATGGGVGAQAGGTGAQAGQWGGWTQHAASLLVGVAAVVDAPRWAFGAPAALVACALAYPLAVVVRAGLPVLARRLGFPLDAVNLGGLTLFVALGFALRYGGRLYPNSMHGDIGFHHNRFNDMVWGLIQILSTNRGVDFPYPPAPYLIVAPLTLINIDPRTALQLGAALADAIGAVAVYVIATRVVAPRTALLAAGIYLFTAATFMVGWWSFSTHIYTQLLHLLLVAALALAWPAWVVGTRDLGRRWTWVVGALLSLVFLGHFGFLINTALLLGGVVGAVWVAGWRGAEWARAVRGPLTAAVVGAGLFAGLCFYSAYLPLFIGQLQTAGAGGLTAVASRGPVSRAYLWEILWRAGLITHFGLFPLLLMSAGLWLISRERRAGADEHGARVVCWLMIGSLGVALLFAALPFITLLTNSPRWMLFIAWVVAVGAAAATAQIWRMGWLGRLAVLAMGAVVLANTAWVWIAPMLWRIRPPEPF